METIFKAAIVCESSPGREVEVGIRLVQQLGFRQHSFGPRTPLGRRRLACAPFVRPRNVWFTVIHLGHIIRISVVRKIVRV
jgi:hypothetical protein